MYILVLSPAKKLKKDKTEYSAEIKSALTDEHREVKLVETFSPLLGFELGRAVKQKPDLIVIPEDLKDEKDFRSKFAFIISRNERKVQNIPDAKEKIDVARTLSDIKTNARYLIGKLRKQEVKKEPREEKYVSYNRKKTRVFKLDFDGKTVYAFSCAGVKTAVIPRDMSSEEIKVPTATRSAKES